MAGQQWPVAVQLFEDLLKDSLQLDLIACNSVVSACEKGGQWQAALGILQHVSCCAFRLGAFCFLWAGTCRFIEIEIAELGLSWILVKGCHPTLLFTTCNYAIHR